jgi:hypothetical protein
MAAFLSGEMKDTVQMHPVGAYGLYFFLSLCVFNLTSGASSSGAFLFS